MEVKILTTINELVYIKDKWDECINNMERPEIFYYFNWIGNYYKEINKKNNKLFVITIIEQNKIIAIAPLCITKKSRALKESKILKFINDDIVDYCMIYIDKNYNSYKMIKKIFEVLNENEKKWDYIELNNINSKNSECYIINEIAKKHFNFISFVNNSAITPFMNYKNFDKKLNLKQIKDIDRHEKKLREISNVEICVNTSFNYDIWKEFVLLHKQRWNDSILNNDNYLNFYEKIIDELKQKDQLEFSYIKIEGEIAAVHFGFRNNKKVYYYMPIFSQKYAHHAVGSILLKNIIYYYKNISMEVFDFLRGNEEYKYYWTDKVNENYCITLVNKKSKFISIKILLNELKLVIKKIK